MKIKFTSHSVERSLERLGMTGVELNRYISIGLRNGFIDNEKIFKKGIHKYKLKSKKITLILKGNKLITVWK